MAAIAIRMIAFALRGLIGLPWPRADSGATRAGVIEPPLLGRRRFPRRRFPRGASKNGASNEQSRGRDERELVHADGDHPWRQLIEPEAEGEGDPGQAADEGAEYQEALGNDR